MSGADPSAGDGQRPPPSGSVRARADVAPIGYLLKCFPRLSETFILNEVLELERQGVTLRVYSLNEPQEPVRHRLCEQVRSPIAYLSYPLLPAWRSYLSAHAALFWRHPLRYLVTFLSVLASLDVDLCERFVQAGAVARLVRRDGVRHLHAGFVHFPGSVAWIVHRITGIPFSLATHARDVYLSRPGLLGKKLSEATVVFTCNRYNLPNLEALARPYGAAKLKHVYHGADLQRFAFGPSGLADPPLVLAVGRLVEKKGFEDLIAACALLRKRGRRFQCRIIAGSRDRWDQIQAQIKELDLSSTVVVEGPLTQEEVSSWYRQATLFALPCLLARDGDRDGIPNVLVEAAASGVPIVSTPVSGVPELIQNDVTGLLVPPRDPAALAAAIERLLESPELRTRLARGARAHVETHFDLRRNGEAVAREFRRAVGSAAAADARELEIASR